MGAYLVKFVSVDKDEQGEITAIHVEADLETRNGNPADGRKVKGTIHWVSGEYAVDATVRLYEKLFTVENVGDLPEGENYLDYVNPDSLEELTGCKLEPCMAKEAPGQRYQFVRTGYFYPDSHTPGVYNRIVTLRDTWAKQNK